MIVNLEVEPTLDVDVEYEYERSYCVTDPPTVTITRATVTTVIDGVRTETDVMPLLSNAKLQSITESIIEQHEGA